MKKQYRANYVEQQKGLNPTSILIRLVVQQVLCKFEFQRQNPCSQRAREQEEANQRTAFTIQKSKPEANIANATATRPV